MTPTELLALSGVIVAILLVVLRHVVEKHLEAIERIPDKGWFERVEKHLTRGHEHANRLEAHEFILAKINKAQDDFEERIRALEFQMNQE